MLSRPQQILLKRAQAEARFSDEDYRDAIQSVFGADDCRSSKDPRLTDRHLDILLSYIESIFWNEVDKGTLQPVCKPNAVFRQRGYWAARNRKGETSRDRFVERELSAECERLEAALAALGCGLKYFQAIQTRIVPWSLPAYRAALARTLKAKQKQPAGNV